MKTPTTCLEASKILFEYSDVVPEVESCHRLQGKATILELFGDVPLPKEVSEEFAWDRIFDYLKKAAR